MWRLVSGARLGNGRGPRSVFACVDAPGGAAARYLISFVREERDGAPLVLGLCIVEAAGATAALAVARTVWEQVGPARVVRIPAHVVIDGADLNRRIPREEAAALCERLELQLPHHVGQGHPARP